MKKLSALIALALVLTIGGAYATWTFATDTAADAVVRDITISMDVQEAGAMGTLTATFTPNFEVIPGTGNVPTLKNNASDQNLVITFTPATNAEKEIKDSGIPVKVSIAVQTAFTSGTEENVIGVKSGNGVTIDTSSWTKIDGSFTATVTSDTIMSWLQINDTAALTNVAAANAFMAAVQAGRLQITVTPNVGG